jgi:hypothetical protein
MRNIFRRLRTIPDLEFFDREIVEARDPLRQFRRVDTAVLPRRSAPDNNQIVVLSSRDLLLLNYLLEPWQL